MRVKISRIDSSLPLPEYKTSGAVAFDLYSRLEVKIPPQEVVPIPMNLVIQVPSGYMLYLKDRSSTALRKGLLATAGIIDQDFCGPQDEILFQVYNYRKDIAVVERGERIAQASFIRIEKVSWEEEAFNEKARKQKTNRGGFGTTGF